MAMIVVSLCCRILATISQVIDVAVLSVAEHAPAWESSIVPSDLAARIRRQSAQLARTMLHRGAWHGASIRRSFVLDRGWGLANEGVATGPGGRGHRSRGREGYRGFSHGTKNLQRV